MEVKTLVLGSVAAAAAALLLAGCGGGPEPRAVPDLRGSRLDLAERRLDALGLEYERVGGGTFGIVVRSRWSVCEQHPAPGVVAARVELVVARTCPPRRQPQPPVPLPPVVPDVTFEDVDDAQDALAARGIASRVLPEGLTLEQRLDWQVCEQEPDAGQRASAVVLLAKPSC
jgi:hypothetical protein